MAEADPRKRPSFQWYPGDAQRDTALRSCCLEARGLWREMLDLMHDGEPYGFLTAGGVPIADAQLARMVGITPRRCTVLLSELEQRGIYSRTEEGVIYSRRMVRDEHIRAVRAASGRLGGNPNLVNQPPKQTPTPAVAVAVCSLQSASAKGGNGPPPDLLEAGEVVQRIRALRQSQAGSGRHYIDVKAVEALGSDVARAYKALGGAPRFLVDDAKETSILIAQFGKALYSARNQ